MRSLWGREGTLATDSTTGLRARSMHDSAPYMPSSRCVDSKRSMHGPLVDGLYMGLLSKWGY